MHVERFGFGGSFSLDHHCFETLEPARLQGKFYQVHTVQRLGTVSVSIQQNTHDVSVHQCWQRQRGGVRGHSIAFTVHRIKVSLVQQQLGKRFDILQLRRQHHRGGAIHVGVVGVGALSDHQFDRPNIAHSDCAHQRRPR